MSPSLPHRGGGGGGGIDSASKQPLNLNLWILLKEAPGVHSYTHLPKWHRAFLSLEGRGKVRVKTPPPIPSLQGMGFSDNLAVDHKLTPGVTVLSSQSQIKGSPQDVDKQPKPYRGYL